MYLRFAQTTVGDMSFAVRSVGVSLGPGLVDVVDGLVVNPHPPARVISQLKACPAAARRVVGGMGA